MKKEYRKKESFKGNSIYIMHGKAYQEDKVKCPVCKKISFFHDFCPGEGDDVGSESASPEMICPFCKATLSGRDEKKYHNGYEDWEMSSYRIYTDKENGLISAVIYLKRTVVLYDKNILSEKYYNLRMVFNTKTGQSYAMEMRTQSGKKKKSRMYKAPSLLNFTLSGLNSTFFVYAYNWYRHACSCPAFTEDVRAALSELHGKEIPREGSLEYNDCGSFQGRNAYFFYLVLWNYIPGMSDVFYKVGNWMIQRYFVSPSYHMPSETDRIMNRRYRNVIRRIKSNYKTGTINTDILKKKGIPDTKATRKALYSNPLFVIGYSHFLSLGFKDHNNIMALSSSTKVLVATIKYKENETNDKYNSPGKFMNQLLNIKGETNVRKLMEKTPLGQFGGAFDDCIFQYNRILEALKQEKLEDTSAFRGNIEEIDRKLSRMYSYLHAEEEKKIFRWSEQTKRLEGEEDGIRFVLPDNSMDLFVTGDKMNICVYSYTNRVLSGESIIILMMDHDKHVGCIELSDDVSPQKYILKQVKAQYNGKLKGNHKDAFLKWLSNMPADLKIDTDICYDYKSMTGLKDEAEFGSFRFFPPF